MKCLANYDNERVSRLLADGMNIDSRVIDNDKISDHHAIIPTNLIGRLGDMSLSEDEKNIVGLVINRFLCTLDKPYIFNETKYEFTCEGEVFNLTVKTPEQLGWKRYSVSDTEKNITVDYYENDTFTAENISVKQGETQPSKRFTESSLLAVMENIDRLIPDKYLSEFVKDRGLGTPATRAAIIEELIAAGYIERKNKQLISTEYGRKFAASLPENVKSAELTAQWEQALSDIEKGVGSADSLLSEIIKNVSEIVSFEKSRDSRSVVSRTKTVGTCPRCGKSVVENSKGFSCSAGRENCGFFIFKSDKRIGRNYTAAEISELLRTGRVTLKNCVSSNGKKYSAVFSLDDTGKYVNLRFERFAGSNKNV